MKLSSLVILAAVVLASAASGAQAETVVVGGLELRLPPEWARKVDGPRTFLAPKNYTGRVIEVLALDAMPPARPEAFEALLGNERLDVAEVKAITRDGAKVLTATGKLVGRKARFDVDVLVVEVERKAAMLVSFVGSDQDPLIRSHNRQILGSARVPGPRITFGFRDPKTAGLVAPPKPLVERVMTFARRLDQKLRLPRPLAITFEECGEVNAFYNRDKHLITMCHEFYADNVKLFTSAGHSRPEAERLAADTFTFTFFHEFGHAMVSELALPITGSGEAAADEIATLLVSGKNPELQRLALAQARRYEVRIAQPGHKDRHFSTHPFDSVRKENILCLLYGADKAKYEALMKSFDVSRRKLLTCERDAEARKTSWSRLLERHIVKN
jgi:hypothetical protein